MVDLQGHGVVRRHSARRDPRREPHTFPDKEAPVLDNEIRRFRRERRQQAAESLLDRPARVGRLARCRLPVETFLGRHVKPGPPWFGAAAPVAVASQGPRDETRWLRASTIDDFVARACRRYAARKIGRIGRVVLRRFLDDDRVLHEPLSPLSPACLTMLFQVPGGRSRLSLPAMVTFPGFTGCRNCR